MLMVGKGLGRWKTIPAMRLTSIGFIFRIFRLFIKISPDIRISG